ncbi:hypothetical protein DL89DRAFT_67882 [Linderina pennispora]|uniref:Uncharacterized protein n=1 Tax=Linderina pennispora TaxID=61395 RepID=A0A1Y1VZG6_9FUNG|nr:uncharacterized protein DL89DRAFT_67882 [Linderina pennispora]ORX66244.1 hypothetical protein DL89DRAFT_67882 [Linderina pennispora]
MQFLCRSGCAWDNNRLTRPDNQRDALCRNARQARKRWRLHNRRCAVSREHRQRRRMHSTMGAGRLRQSRVGRRSVEMTVPPRRMEPGRCIACRPRVCQIINCAHTEPPQANVEAQ